MVSGVKAEGRDIIRGLPSSMLWVLNFTMQIRLKLILKSKSSQLQPHCLISLSWLPYGGPYGNDLVGSYVEGLILFSLVVWFLTFGDSSVLVLCVVWKLLCSQIPRLPGMRPVERVCFCHQQFFLIHAQHSGGFLGNTIGEQINKRVYFFKHTLALWFTEEMGVARINKAWGWGFLLHSWRRWMRVPGLGSLELTLWIWQYRLCDVWKSDFYLLNIMILTSKVARERNHFLTMYRTSEGE